MDTEKLNKAIGIFEKIMKYQEKAEQLRVQLNMITKDFNESDLDYFNYNTQRY